MKLKKKSQKSSVRSKRSKKQSTGKLSLGAVKRKKKSPEKKIPAKKGIAKFINKRAILQVPINEYKQGNFCRRKTDLVGCEKLSDIELVKLVMTKNPDLYKVLFKRYEKSLYIYIFHMVRNKEEVEDLLQNVFAKTFKSLSSFDTERKFSSWIYRIAHNEAVNFIKRKSKRTLVSWEDVSASKDKLEMSVDAEDVAENFMHKEITKEVDEALEKIPEKYKNILMMRYFEEYSYEDIGKILGKPVNTVGTLINRAKKKLFEVVNEERMK